MSTTENPQSNYILERISYILASMVHTIGFEDKGELKPNCIGVVSDAAYEICSSYHTMLKVSPGQLVLG